MKKIYFLLFFCFFAFQAQATTYYVKTGGNNSSAGTSWSTAKADLQNAINASSAGDEIWIAAGTYKPTLMPTGMTGTTARDKSFYLDKNIGIYGGFAGTETLLSQRNSASNPVILSGDIGTVGSSSDNCYHVFISEGLTSAAVLDGVTITGGNANRSGNTSFSGGNVLGSRGGGISNYSSSPTFSNLIITNNTASSSGGGLWLFTDSSPTISNVTITNNTADNGGGFYLYVRSNPTLSNVTISNNTGSQYGGGMVIQSSSPTLTNVTICNNICGASGGGGINVSASTVTIKNTIFWGNTKDTLSNVTGSDIKKDAGSTITITYSLVQLASSSYTSGNSNALTSATNMVYATDPSFINASDPDGADNVWMTKDDGLKLKSTSPAVDAGLNSAISSYSTDILGTTRVMNTTVNMGAYEMSACQQGNTLPTAAGTYAAIYSDIEGSYTCYCDDNGQFILGLDLNSTGAVVPTTGVSLEIGATTTTSWSTAGGIITNANGGAIINRKWDVVPTTQPTSDVTVIFPFTHTEYGDVVTALSAISTTITNANQLEMYKLTSAGTFADPHASGATGVALPHGASASTSNWVWSQHGNGTDHLATYKVASFSGGGGGGGASGSPLPVELIHFDAQPAANHTADLHWATASEINNSHFVIERSYDGRTFETVGNVTGNGTTSQLIDYNYTDRSIAKSQNTAYYRLKQVDYDGAYEYSDVRVVRFDRRADRLEIAAYPNPFNQEVTIHVNANEPYTIQVTDINGVVVLSVDRTENRTHRLDVSEYTAGVYIIKVTSTQGTQHLKIIKQ